MAVAEEELLWQIKDLTKVISLSTEVVKDAWKERYDFHPSGEFVFLPEPCPWKVALAGFEVEEDKVGLTKFVVLQDQRKLWRI